MRTTRAEFTKLLTLPATWFAAIAGIAVSVGVTLISAGSSTPGPDTGYSSLALGVAGAVVIGVIAVSSEYTVESEEAAASRQIATTFTATPSRLRILLAKLVTVSVSSALLSVIAIIAVFTMTALLLGDRAPAIGGPELGRMGGMVLYWMLVSLLAFGLTMLTRNGVIPMAILIANFSAVPITFLLTRVTPLANYLPDMAGMRLWSQELDTGVHLTPGIGGLIMALWVCALLVVASAVLVRRDA